MRGVRRAQGLDLSQSRCGGGGRAFLDEPAPLGEPWGDQRGRLAVEVVERGVVAQVPLPQQFGEALARPSPAAAAPVRGSVCRQDRAARRRRGSARGPGTRVGRS